jgi:PhnB protein
MIDFYVAAFGAKELFRLDMPDGKIGHAEILIADRARVLLADEFPEWNCLSPATVGGTGSSIMIYVEDVDALAKQAEAAGAKILMPPEDQFYGDRSCKIEDPSGHAWMFATHIEEVSPEEMQKRAQQMFGGTP